jgi:hypothetical protein
MRATLPLLLLLLLLGCPGERRPEARALALYERGQGQLEAGDYQAAAESFRLATERDPLRPVLRSWQAWALAQGGDPAAAIALLEGPGAPALGPHDRYNLAAWHARLGENESALALLAAALQDDPGLRSGLRDDPDLRGLLEAGTMSARLDDLALRAIMVGEEGAILAGEPYDLELDVQPGELRLSLAWEQPLPPGFTLRRVVDDRSAESATESLRVVRYRVRTSVGGEGSLGPWTLLAEDATVAIPEVPWQAVVPPGVLLDEAEAPWDLDPAWWTPREALEGLQSGSAALRHGLLVVCYQRGDVLGVGGGAVLEPPLEIELREDDQPTLLAKAWRWAPGAERARVTLTRNGGVVLDVELLREP